MDSPHTDEIFRRPVENVQLDQDGFHDLEPIDDIRELLVDNLSHHIARFDDLNLLDGDRLLDSLQVITALMNRDFRALTRLSPGDEIVATGETIFTITSSEIASAPAIRNLSDDILLYGTVQPLELHSIPDQQELDIIRRLNITHEQLEPVDLLRINPFGLMLKLADARLVDVNGREEEIPADVAVLLPLNYTTLHLKRVV